MKRYLFTIGLVLVLLLPQIKVAAATEDNKPVKNVQICEFITHDTGTGAEIDWAYYVNKLRIDNNLAEIELSEELGDVAKDMLTKFPKMEKPDSYRNLAGWVRTFTEEREIFQNNCLGAYYLKIEGTPEELVSSMSNLFVNQNMGTAQGYYIQNGYILYIFAR